MTGIYCIYNLANRKCYVGQAKDIEKRWKEHRQKLRRGKHDNEHLQRAWQMYGESTFRFMVLEYCTEDRLNELEALYIEECDAYENGYNMTLGGEGTRGFYHTDEYKQRMSDRMKSREVSEETRRRIAEAATGRPCIKTKARLNGYKITSEKLKGRTRTKEHCRHLSEAKMGSTPWNKGKKMPEGYKHPWLGRHHSDETKRKISEAHTGMKQSREQVLKKSKGVLCVETGQLYDSITEAAKAYGVSVYAVSNALRGKSQTAAKQHWQYA